MRLSFYFAKEQQLNLTAWKTEKSDIDRRVGIEV
jgi:hypothetical protein